MQSWLLLYRRTIRPPGWLAFLLWGALLTAAPDGTVPYLSLKVVAGRLGMELHARDGPQEVRLVSEWTTLVFEEHQRDFLLNGTRVFLGYPVGRQGRHLAIAEADYADTLQPLLTPQVFTPPQVPTRVMVDAGHGGKDPGARNTHLELEEKALVLDFAKVLARHLQKAGFEVSFTREEDRFLGLAERARIANSSGSDVFLSLHFNASAKPGVSGVETFAFTPHRTPSSARADLSATDLRRYPGNANDTWNLLLGFYVQRQMQESLPVKDRGLKRARFVVLRDLEIPGILIEGGFLSHDAEARRVATSAYRERLATAITKGVSTYRRTIHRLDRERDRP